MDTKFAVYIVIASILMISVISLSINFVSAKTSEPSVCSFSNNGNVASCSTSAHHTLYCTYDTATQHWSCKREKPPIAGAKTGSATPNEMTDSETLNKLTDSQIPLGLKSALDSAIKSQNGSLVKGQSNTQETNSSEMKVGNSPTPPQCPSTGPIPPDCTMKPPLK